MKGEPMSACSDPQTRWNGACRGVIAIVLTAAAACASDPSQPSSIPCGAVTCGANATCVADGMCGCEAGFTGDPVRGCSMPGQSSGPGSHGTGGAPGDSSGPCPSCLVHVPPSYSPATPMPLVVALHGDEGRDFGLASATQGVIASWRDAADRAAFIVLAPACPAAEGCDGAWSDWLAAENYDLDPATIAWLDAQVDAIEHEYNIATDHEDLAGYSGGGYWLGYFAQARASRYAGVAFVAGGMPAYAAYNGCPACKIPGYFLVGDSDPRTAQIDQLASSFQQCDEEVKSDVIAGGTHESTIASLTSGKADAILSWLQSRPLACH
jgi:poly(3-hydroxybutyrate) depolymerase